MGCVQPKNKMTSFSQKMIQLPNSSTYYRIVFNNSLGFEENKKYDISKNPIQQRRIQSKQAYSTQNIHQLSSQI